MASTPPAAVGFMLLSVFFLPLNSYRLPLNFCIFSLPFEDAKTIWMVNYFNQCLTAPCCAIVCSTFFPMIVFLVSHTCWKVEVLIVHMEKLKQISIESKTVENVQIIDESMRKIIDLSCLFFEWFNEAKQILRFNFLTDFSILSFILCMSLYSITVDPFESFEAYIMVVLPMSQLFIYCWNGTRLTVRIEKLSATVYDVSWYNMNCEQQKVMQMILIMTQSMRGFDGIFKQVNFETFQKVCELKFCFK